METEKQFTEIALYRNTLPQRQMLVLLDWLCQLVDKGTVVLPNGVVLKSACDNKAGGLSELFCAINKLFVLNSEPRKHLPAIFIMKCAITPDRLDTGVTFDVLHLNFKMQGIEISASFSTLQHINYVKGGLLTYFGKVKNDVLAKAGSHEVIRP